MAVASNDMTPQAPSPGHTNGVVKACDPWPEPYYLEGGFRRVKPYHYTYNTHCKERWRNRPLEEIFLSEFRDRTPDYYRKALDSGLVTVNGKPAGRDTVIKNGQVLSHTTHRHEPPVSSQPIGIIHEDDDLLVIDKPAGIPVHSAGRYHHNSVVEILQADREDGWIARPCNRLDRLTSGVMFIGKHPKGAEKMSNQLRARSVQKEYIARVKGKFPDGVVVCDQPIMQVSPKLGLNRVRATGKTATTKFRRIAYYPPEWEQPARPAADTTEQSSDGPVPRPATPPPALYNEAEGYIPGPPDLERPDLLEQTGLRTGLAANESHGDRDEEIMERLNKMGKTELPDTGSYRNHFTAAPNLPVDTDPAVLAEIMSREQQAATEDYEKRKGERLSGALCDVCGTELYSDPGVHELGIFLHAVSYADLEGDWHYRSGMPNWGLPPYGLDGPREVPDWVPAAEGEEVVIGHGTVPPEIGGDDEPEARGAKSSDQVLLEGVGLLNISEATNRLNAAQTTIKAEEGSVSAPS
ncbi:Pseudouridine synthase RluC/RluD [Penicillium chermesinum]|nr:Pseudouridine synthase RluC/RluD [Penicillium chermesinum]